jgi:hypothetical protein
MKKKPVTLDDLLAVLKQVDAPPPNAFRVSDLLARGYSPDAASHWLKRSLGNGTIKPVGKFIMQDARGRRNRVPFYVAT